ncbi:hypothetical protein L596_003231 [Steinernema carpocapsae]|uniref:DH domain-containing protein n=1 Tax=Steinernema carpocapsae TaxID=34508 RepID=A0A4U8UVW5_STECR|nr:hypothetical protein L596_003231 [Steinernema carpocapsae]
MMSQLYTEFKRNVRNRCSKRQDQEARATHGRPESSSVAVFANPVVQELISSEKAYLTFLDKISENFIKLMERRKLISRDESQLLFGEIETIYQVNSILYEGLQRGEIREAFECFLPYTKLYNRYAEKFERAQSFHAEKMKKDRRYCNFVTTAEIEMENKLDSLLIMPIQRVPRYIMLLNQLRNAHIVGGIEGIVGKLQIITRQIDAFVAESKNTEEMLEIEKKLNFLDGLIAPGRKLIKSGVLYEVLENTRMKRHIWLFNDILIAAKKKINGRYECCVVLPIRHCLLQSSVSNFSFTIYCRSQQVLLTSDSYGISQSWILTIELIISQAKACRSTLRKESSKQQPWKRRKTFAQQARHVSTKIETEVMNLNPLERTRNSSVLSCLPCLGTRNRTSPKTRLPPYTKSQKQRFGASQRPVPWWVTESTATS